MVNQAQTPLSGRSYSRLRAAYAERLKRSAESIDNILLRKQLNPLSTHDLQSALHLAHGLSGSGATFGFPEISEKGKNAEIFLNDLLKITASQDNMDEQDFIQLEEIMLSLKNCCLKESEKEYESNSFVTEEEEKSLNRKLCVLIADDDEDILDILSHKLQKKGIKTVLAKNGEEALEMVSECAPDLIILDIMMPGMDGHEVLKKLKSNPASVSTPVIMLTAQHERKNFINSMHEGALEFVLKPVDPEQFTEKVSKILDFSRYMILIADDDPLILNLLDSKFKSIGFKTCLAEDGKRAWDYIQKYKPDIVILDLAMPEISGHDLIKKIKAGNFSEEMPVIVLSACVEQDKTQACLDSGAKSCISKPFIPDDLVDLTIDLIKKRAFSLKTLSF